MADTDTKIKNVVAASDDSQSTQEEEQDGIATKIDLGIYLEKLTLGPKKKLLVLPLAGIIVHRAHVRSPETIPKTRRPDFSYGKFKVYKRPFCEGFLMFCFERFQVGLWSSAMEHNLQKVLTHALGDLQNEFVFTWKPVFLKQLKFIWEKYPSEKYSSSNILLITDPEKALLNPPNTGIFPKKYDFDNEDDDFLGPNGELRAYLDGLSNAKDVPSYVKDHPFGEPAITPSHPDWKFYVKKKVMIIPTESDIKNVDLASTSDDSRSTQEEEHDRMETKLDLGISLEKLTLRPKKKLLVLPLTGIVVHRAHLRSPAGIPKNRRPDFCYGNFLVYRRPFCEGFLKFCFERFEVGLWSSAMEYNIQKALFEIVGDMKDKFLFTWDQTQCTKTGFMCVWNKNKPVFLKELKYIWEKYENYSASNTLLISDPEKALLNPPYTAIFPKRHDFNDEDDDFLGPYGKFRAFLAGLAEAEDVQSYVKEHPFGEPAMSPSHPEWKHYSKIILFYVKEKIADHKNRDMNNYEDEEQRISDWYIKGRRNKEASSSIYTRARPNTSNGPDP
ncbi:hypothetical protein LXL04_032577 [Taraxacum kok-saghyz]